MNQILLSLLLLLVLTLVGHVQSFPQDDLIAKLPGLETQPTFKQYSGYLHGISDNVQLHYWFVEANVNPKEKEDGDTNDLPLLLWLNGGPGCSSLEGILAENGPFNVQPGRKLEVNPYSWNTLANILYLEAPAGVGFSYAKDANSTTGDNLTAANNAAAIKEFFRKFPEHKHRDFYISGESYGGVYVPTLALALMKDASVKVKGIAVGNGLTSYNFNDNSLLYYANYHGFVERSVWQRLIESCCEDKDREMCRFTENKSQNCVQMVSEIDKIINNGFNLYNILDECYGGVKASMLSNTFTNYQFASSNLFRGNHLVRGRKDFFFRHRDSLVRFPETLPNMVIPCVDDSALEDYLNWEDVKNALHIKPGLPAFSICNEDINYNYVREYTDLTEQYKKLLEDGVKIMFYNGDMDMACNFLGQEWFVDNLSLNQITPMTQWLYMEKDGTQQIGGFHKSFASTLNPNVQLDYYTVKGAGHMVPGDKPVSSLSLLKVFLDNNH